MTEISNDISVSVNLIARKGDTYSRDFTVKDNAGGDYDFTNYNAKLQIKEKSYDTTFKIELTSGNGITLSTGQLSILIDANTMQNMVAKNYYYDLQLTYPSGEIKTWLAGKFTVTQDVTR